jgi:acyl-CoA reductase-like NAD-dependent aldehyde dehydrogenase
LAKTFKTYNPYDNSLLGEFTFDTKEQVDKVLSLLAEGRKVQKKLCAFERAQILENLSNLLKKHSEELSQLVTKEVGKTIADSRVELTRSANTAFASSFEARNIPGHAIDVAAFPPYKNNVAMVLRRPIGTILCITPFNFPINLALHKIGPAFAVGNTIFFKPGPQNYQSGKRLVELCHEAGMPKETIQFCYPDIAELEEVIAGDGIHCVSFTGGTATADAIAKNAGRKKLLFELGGNDPLILMPDGDIDLAVSTTINQRFATAGQRCSAAKRLFIHEDCYEEFKNKLVESTSQLVVGDPTKDETFVGPVVSKQSADLVQLRIQDAIKQGATCLIGNIRDGNIIYPTILENLNLDSDVIRDETFGPVVPLVKFTDLDEVIRIVNSSNYGLQSGVFTHDIRVIKKLYNELEVGALAVNNGPGFRAEHIPFGGVKDSGSGREGVKYAIEEMSYLKTLIL